MEDRSNQNLDRIAAKLGFELADRNESNAEELERVLTKALNILIEDGLFAYAIWLESKKEKESKDIIDSSFDLLEKAGIIQIQVDSSKAERLRKVILEDISQHIQKTILASYLLERMLVYAIYRAKALKAEKGGT